MNQFLKRVAYLDFAKVMILAAIVGGLYFYLYYDSGSALQTKLDELQSQMAAEEAKRKDTEATLKEVDRMKIAVGLLSEQYQVISKKLPDQLSSIEMNRAIDGFAKSSSVNIKSRKPSLNTLKSEVIEEVPIELTLEGNYSELALFVYNISTAERLARVKRIQITSGDSAGISFDSAKLKLDGTVVGYKLAPDSSKDNKDSKENK